MESKFKPGEKVYYVSVYNEVDNRNFAEISIDIIESVVFYKDRIAYWLPSCDWEVDESHVVAYNKNSLFEYLSNNMRVNEKE